MGIVLYLFMFCDVAAITRNAAVRVWKYLSSRGPLASESVPGPQIFQGNSNIRTHHFDETTISTCFKPHGPLRKGLHSPCESFRGGKGSLKCLHSSYTTCSVLVQDLFRTLSVLCQYFVNTCSELVQDLFGTCSGLAQYFVSTCSLQFQNLSRTLFGLFL